MIKDAYKNKLLSDLPEEIWKDIEGYEGYYMVSNYGRVKSLERVIEHPRIGSQLIHPRILSQNINKSSSKHFNDFYVNLLVALTKNGKTIAYSVKRIVYNTFIEKLDYEKDLMCIVHKDYNGYNNAVSNLEKLSYKERFNKRIKSRGRFHNSLIEADRTNWNKPKLGIAIKHISPEGKVTKYESIKAASKAIKMDEGSISKYLKGKRGPIRGHKFEFQELNNEG